MLDRDWGGSFRWRRDGRPLKSREPSRLTSRLGVEGLEDRQLLAAALATIPNVTVPAQVGYQVPVNGSASGATQQTFTVTSSNPAIKASVAQGNFVTVNVSHTASSTPGDTSFNGAFTYQLFQDLTPNTASRIQSFTNGTLTGVPGNYNGTEFFRVVKGFSGQAGPTDTVIQGGPQGVSGSGTNPAELNPQLAFVQPGSVAIARGTAPNTDGQEFFVTAGPQPGLNFGYTIYGQVVSGQDVVAEIGSVPTHKNASGENSAPDSPVTITTATTSATNPNGVIHIDATNATPGATSTITVTATDPATKTTASTSFTVNVGAAITPAPAKATFAPTSQPTGPVTTPVNQPVTVNVPFQGNNTNNPAVTSAYASVTPPTNGTVTFDPVKQTALYTPAKDFKGTDTFSYRLVNTNSTLNADPVSSPSATQTVTVTTIALAPTAQAPSPLTQSIQANQTATYSVPFQSNNAGNPGVTSAYVLVTKPAHGAVTFDLAKQTAVYTPAKGFQGSDSFSYRVVNTDTASGATASSSTESASVNVGVAGPVSRPISQAVIKNTPTTIKLAFTPAATGTTKVAIVTPPTHGTLSAINTTTNTVVYTPAAGFTGLDGFTYQATETDSSTNPPTSIPGNIATASLGVGTSTGAVRQIGNVLVVTPLPRTDKGVNQIVVSQQANPANPAVGNILVTVNGVLDTLQAQALTNDPTGGIGRIVVYGSKAGDNVTVQPGVDKTINVTLDGGHGGTNVLQAGSGPTREHGWFGQNTLIGGTGPNQLIGAAGHVKFKPTATTDEIFAGVPHPGYYNYRSYNGRVSYQIHPPGGTFYKFVNGHTVPTSTPTVVPKSVAATTPKTTTAATKKA